MCDIYYYYYNFRKTIVCDSVVRLQCMWPISQNIRKKKRENLIPITYLKTSAR